MGCGPRSIMPRFTDEEIAETVRRGGLLTMEMEFNRECNFRCPYCYAAPRPLAGPDLSKEKFKDAISEARGLGARMIVVLGGEPMLYPHLLEMVGHIRSHGMWAEIFTNGARMTEDNARALHEAGASVVLKMNSFKAEVQNALAGTDAAYAQIGQALQNLRRAGYPGRGGRLGISTVVSALNYDEIAPLWRWLRAEGIAPYVESITPHGAASGGPEIGVSPGRVGALFERLSEIDRGLGRAWVPQPPIAGAECLRHRYSCLVAANGDVYPCVGVTIPAGNVNASPLGSIIRSSEVIDRLRNYRSHISGPCRACGLAHRCYGCRGAAYRLTGDYLASDPLCWRIPRLPADAAPLVPHAKPMRLIGRLIEAGPDTAAAEATISRQTPFVLPEGSLDETAYVELIAQAAAAWTGFMHAGSGGPPAEGFITGIRDFRIHGVAGVGDTLRVAIARIARFGDEMEALRGEVYRGDTLLAEGEIRVLHGAAGGRA